MFEVRELSVRYGDEALRGVDLAAGTGEVVGVVGAGGRLLLRTVAGLLMPATGAVRLDDDELTGLPHADVAALGVVLVRAGDRPPGVLTVAENLARGAAGRHGAPARQARVAEVLGWFPALDAGRRTDALDDATAALLAVAVGVARGPRLLLVDGLAAACGRSVAGRAAYRAALAGLRAVAAEGTRVLVADEAGDPAAYDRAYVLDAGRVRDWPDQP